MTFYRDKPKDDWPGPYSSGAGAASSDEGKPDFAQMGRQAAEASTRWLDSGIRRMVDEAIRAYNGEHPAGSKYLSEDYRFRSKLFRPKLRSAQRKSEAAAAGAFFTTAQLVDISAEDDSDDMQLASAGVMSHLVQYRLSKTIPWFLTVMGGWQDGSVPGVVISKQWWEYERKKGPVVKVPVPHPLFPDQPLIDPATNEPMMGESQTWDVVHDRPRVDLIAFENFRLSPTADWRDPVNTSPYVIEIVPMTVQAVEERMEAIDDKTGQPKWKKLDRTLIAKARATPNDPTRNVREQGRLPSTQADPGLSDYDLIYVHKVILRHKGQDWCFDQLGTFDLLSEPKKLEEVYLTGKRPYVMGYVTFEAHKSYPRSKASSVMGYQTLLNTLTNLAVDNAQLALNPRQKVRRGKNVSIDQVRRFMPGNPIFLDDPQGDLVWDRPPDVSQGVYLERDRANVDFDELFGNFSQSTIQTQRSLNETVGGMRMLEGASGSVNEYDLRCFTETWVEKVLMQVVELEQAYETDQVILGIAGRKAQIQRYGQNEVTDEMLNQDLTVRVNVGIGATDPTQKLGRFMGAAGAVGQIFGEKARSWAKPEEIVQEVFGYAGFRDATRFFDFKADPEKEEMQRVIGELKAKLADKQADREVKVTTAQISAAAPVMGQETERAKVGIPTPLHGAEFPPLSLIHDAAVAPPPPPQAMAANGP